MATHGIQVSQSGSDVRTATEKELLLNTNFELLKVFMSGKVSGSGWFEITHSLGYVPQFLVYVQDAGGEFKEGAYFLATADQTKAYARADTSKLYVNRGQFSGDAIYYIFYEQT
jgi:hypothetical protein